MAGSEGLTIVDFGSSGGIRLVGFRFPLDAYRFALDVYRAPLDGFRFALDTFRSCLGGIHLGLAACQPTSGGDAADWG